MKAMLSHTNKVTQLVHDELISWTGSLLRDAGLEAVDVWGRFPPEGTVRSHLVLFPYRVGPEPKNLENARGGTLMTREAYPSDRVGRIPKPWRELGMRLLDTVGILFPEAGVIDTPSRHNVAPFPRVDELPKPLRDWYMAQEPDHADSFVLKEDGDLYARPPALHYRPGLSVYAHYIAVAGDAGRGVSDRTSDAPPLSLAALAVLSVGIQKQRNIHVELPPMPFSPELFGYLQATRDALKLSDHEDAGPLAELIEDSLQAVNKTSTYDFAVIPIHDLSMHEFALLTQALQRPLQAVLNFRMAFQLGDEPEFKPSVVVSMRQGRQTKGR